MHEERCQRDKKDDTENEPGNESCGTDCSKVPESRRTPLCLGCISRLLVHRTSVPEQRSETRQQADSGHQTHLVRECQQHLARDLDRPEPVTGSDK